MTAPTITIEHPFDKIVAISLHRPEKRNALNIELLTHLREAVEEAGNTRGTRVIVLRGNGPLFCSGMDLVEAAESKNADESSRLLVDVFESILVSPCVTIASVHGGVYAGGIGLLAAADFAIADAHCKFALPEVLRGLVPTLVGTLLKRQLLARDLRDMMLSGQPITTERAHSMRLINSIAPASELENETFALANLLIQGAPEAQRRCKQLFNTSSNESLIEELRQARKEHHDMRTSTESKEGIKAFLEKRDPTWMN